MKGSKGHKIIELLGRKKIICAFIIFIVFLIVCTTFLYIKALEQSKDKVKTINYTESSKVDYKVYLKENDFFDTEYLGKNKQYISTLIDYVTTNFTYTLKSSEPDLTHSYKYKVDAVVNVKDDKNNNTIYQFSEMLIKEKVLNFNTNKNLTIKENVKIDYHKYNNIIKKFIDVYRLGDTSSTLKINLYVDVENVTSSSMPVATLTIPLTTRTMAIDIKSNSVNATEINVYQEIANKNYLYFSILTTILIIMITIELFIFIKNTKDEKNLYKSKIKKILMNYGSYVQKISNDFDFNDYKKLEMESFEDLLQVRDTIGQPILMKENAKETETNFFITSGSVIYAYILKKEYFKKESETKNNEKGLKNKKAKKD